MSRGFDVGTGFLVSARQEADQIKYIKQRDAFFGLEPTSETIGVLESLKVPYIKRKNQLIIVGEDALKFANIFKKEARRPLHKGVLSKLDLEAFGMLQTVIGNMLGKAVKENELVRYTIPAAPIDEEFDVEYHKQQISNILNSLGYLGEPINEARCILLSELSDKMFSGLSLSFGAGTTNVCLAQYGIDNPRLQFSIARGGDWIDKKSSEVYAGLTATRVQNIKERGLDLLSPNGNLSSDELESTELLEYYAREGISVYYKSLIDNVLRAIKFKFEKEELPEFSEPITMVVAGGTSMPKGFMDLLKTYVQSVNIGLRIGEIRHAKDPLYTVAKGALIAAQLDESKRK